MENLIKDAIGELDREVLTKFSSDRNGTSGSSLTESAVDGIS